MISGSRCPINPFVSRLRTANQIRSLGAIPQPRKPSPPTTTRSETTIRRRDAWSGAARSKKTPRRRCISPASTQRCSGMRTAIGTRSVLVAGSGESKATPSSGDTGQPRWSAARTATVTGNTSPATAVHAGILSRAVTALFRSRVPAAVSAGTPHCYDGSGR